MTTGTATQAKSGLKTYKTNEILFNDGDVADSLFIIQKGQIRLFKPKGKGFIEIGVLRAGEVIGEMAFFDEDGSGKKRSCSAAAMTQVEVIEISFAAFGKTMQSLNPWFKTIINTLASRLRKANSRIKELEDNHTSPAYMGKQTGYEFMKPLEVMRVLGMLFLVFRAHGEIKGQAIALNRRVLNTYTFDTFQMMEVKVEAILDSLKEMGWLDIVDDEDKLPNLLLLKNIDYLKQVFMLFNAEKGLPEEKKMKVSEKAEMLIAKMLEHLPKNPVMDIPNLKITDEIKPKFTKYYVLQPVLDEFKDRNIRANPDWLDDGKSIGLFGELTVLNGKAVIEANMDKVQMMYPVIRYLNILKKSNQEKGSN
jgi:CRP-like cAMP-binding protein